MGRWLVVCAGILLAVAPAAASEGVVVRVTPGAGLSASTYGPGAFVVENRGTQPIRSLRFDLAAALLPDLLFDPDGQAGDTVGKAFTADDGAAQVGLARHRLSVPRAGGWRRLDLTFEHFEPGERFAFSIDVDPASIRGSAPPGPGEAGSVSGLEMAGVQVTAFHPKGRASAPLVPDPIDPGSAVARLDGTALPAPQLHLLRSKGTEAVVHVWGQPDQALTLIALPVARYGRSPLPDSVVGFEPQPVQLGSDGRADITVVLPGHRDGAFWLVMAVPERGPSSRPLAIYGDLLVGQVPGPE